MRALLLVNPKATSTNERVRDVLIRALESEVGLHVEETAYRGHARSLASGAHAEGYGAVIVLGGDGTINEAVNGLLTAEPDRPARERPLFAAIPGGSANVFVRALGLPNDPVEATGAVLEALAAGRRRTIGLGRAIWREESAGVGRTVSRHFTFCAGLGFDAEVVRAVEGIRSTGQRALPTRYVATTVRRFFVTDRRHPALRLTRPGHPDVDGIFLAIVSNTAPWTYAGSIPINPTPLASFETGLDLLGLKRMSLPAVLGLARQIIGPRESLPKGEQLVQLHDVTEFTLAASRPVAFQLDGDYLGEYESVTFRAVPDALQVVV